MKGLIYFMLTILLMLGGSQVTFADLVSNGQVMMNGTGFGDVNTILTVQSTGQQGPIESGCVGVSKQGGGTLNATVAAGYNDVCQGNNVGGMEKPPADFPHNQTFAVSNASQIAIVYNSDQAQNDNGTVTLDDLVAALYNSKGDVIWTSGDWASSITYADTSFESGIGKAGWAFSLDATEAAAAQAAIDANGGSAFLGLSSTISDVDGGPETFFLTTTPSLVPAPEPASLGLFGSGLMLVSWVVRRKRAKGWRARPPEVSPVRHDETHGRG